MFRVSNSSKFGSEVDKEMITEKRMNELIDYADSLSEEDCNFLTYYLVVDKNVDDGLQKALQLNLIKEFLVDEKD